MQATSAQLKPQTSRSAAGLIDAARKVLSMGAAVIRDRSMTYSLSQTHGYQLLQEAVDQLPEHAVLVDHELMIALRSILVCRIALAESLDLPTTAFRQLLERLDASLAA